MIEQNNIENLFHTLEPDLNGVVDIHKLVSNYFYETQKFSRKSNSQVTEILIDILSDYCLEANVRKINSLKFNAILNSKFTREYFPIH